LADLVVKVTGLPSGPGIVYVLTVISCPRGVPGVVVVVVEGRVPEDPVFTFTVGRVPAVVPVGMPALTSTVGGLMLIGTPPPRGTLTGGT